MTNGIRYRLRDRPVVVVSAILALILTISLPLVLLEPRAPAINAVPFRMGM
jgi:hypothetical protein